jgi:hypothetical protein
MKAFVHIGTHKTGTTSLQRWASENRTELASATGLTYYDGLFGPNHYELAMLCMRTNRNMPMRVRRVDWCLDEWHQEAETHVRSQVARDADSLLISAEALSYLRYSDEVERLAGLLRPRELVAIAVLREPESFLRSYREMMLELGFPPSRHRTSFAYVADDSWLVDYDALLDAYRAVLGADRVIALGYETAMQRHGSIIPAILEATGFDPAGIPAWEGFQRNVTHSAPAKRVARVLRATRLLGAARRSRRLLGR